MTYRSLSLQRLLFPIVLVSTLILAAFALNTAFAGPHDSPGLPQPYNASADTAAGPLFTYQGELLNAAGVPITNSALPMVFRLYSVPSGGSTCWAESRTINVQNGRFNVVLGEVTAIPVSCVSADAYLEVVVNGEVMSPREMLTSVASAVVASTLRSGAQVQGPLSVNGNLVATGEVSAYDLKAWNLNIGRGTAFHTNDVDRILHLLPWAGSGWVYDKVCIGCGTGAGLRVNGSTEINGNLNLSGTCARTSLSGSDSLTENGNCQAGSLTTGAIVEANLQTPSERESERIERFSEGDVLCWAGEQLEKCDRANDRLVQAVAGADGKPIIVGAERIRVLGPVSMGDILVSSDVSGYAMVNNDPLPGTVIGQALENLESGSGLIKAMIRKW